MIFANSNTNKYTTQSKTLNFTIKHNGQGTTRAKLRPSSGLFNK